MPISGALWPRASAIWLCKAVILASGTGLQLRRTRLITCNPRINRAKLTDTPAAHRTSKIPASRTCLEGEKIPAASERGGRLDATDGTEWCGTWKTGKTIGWDWIRRGMNPAVGTRRVAISMTGHSPTVSNATSRTACLPAGDHLIIRCTTMAASNRTVAMTDTPIALGRAVSTALSPAVISYPLSFHRLTHGCVGLHPERVVARPAAP